ncbi:phosphoglycerate mutase [Sulfurifustis variabilis]|uniref:Phosphoglycerate mutase n=1 Tax=Sulfurifustis variabilis TaxID=1675686 RepID=A0A1C7AEW0_9GAMM|nr:histidine phosphatase family protein [Sulfurifustis variabilis]BAU49718.1 phosphoglycerate mutase [Sulfurifustis variabilis]
MVEHLPAVYLARHGETAWSASGRHTGRTDIPLTERGEEDARALGARLEGIEFALVLTSPLERARRTAALAGFGSAQAERDLMEWDYGKYEGRRTVDIRRERPGWRLFEDGCPDGETAAVVGARADRLLARLRAIAADALVFAHRDILRVLAARWTGLAALEGRRFYLDTTSLSMLGYHHDPNEPVIRLWNEICVPGSVPGLRATRSGPKAAPESERA